MGRRLTSSIKGEVVKVGDLVKLKPYCKFSDRLALVVEVDRHGVWGNIYISFADQDFPGSCTAIEKNLIVVSEVNLGRLGKPDR